MKEGDEGDEEDEAEEARWGLVLKKAAEEEGTGHPKGQKTENKTLQRACGSFWNFGLEVLSAKDTVVVGTCKMRIWGEIQMMEAWLVMFQRKIMTIRTSSVLFQIKNV